MFKEPFRSAGVCLLPANRFDKRRRPDGMDLWVSPERACASRLQPVCHERRPWIEFSTHPQSRHVAAEVLVVEETLKSAGDLLIGPIDQRPNVPAFQVTILVDCFQNVVVAVGEREVPVSLDVAVGLRDVPAQSGDRAVVCCIGVRSSKVISRALPRPQPFRANLPSRTESRSLAAKDGTLP